jgi:hypothetical protein
MKNQTHHLLPFLARRNGILTCSVLRKAIPPGGWTPSTAPQRGERRGNGDVMKRGVVAFASSVEPHRRLRGAGGALRLSSASLVVMATLAVAVLPPQPAGATTVGSKNASILVNGGFEKPVVPVGTDENFGTGSTFDGWTVIGAEGDVAVVSGNEVYEGLTFRAASGHQCLDLTGGTATETGVQQTVVTTPGTTYTLRFAVGNISSSVDSYYYGKTSTADVLVNGTQVMAATNRKKNSKKVVWKHFGTSFTATSASTTIAFVNGDPAGDNWNGLDSVSLKG